MKLTTEQLQIIENALNEKCNFKKFDDVRLEVMDHIASEIEAEMENHLLPFESAFVKVMTRWNPMILPKTWSRYENAPYIVCKLWKSLDWKVQYSGIPVSIIVTYLFYVLSDHNYSAYLLLFPVLFAGLFSTGFLLYRKATNKVKSTLSMYSLQKIYLQSLGMLAILIINMFLFADGDELSVFPIFYSSFYMSYIMIGKAWVMNKHLKIENQFLKIR